MNKRKLPNSGSNIYKESSNKAPTSVIEYGELCYRHGYKDRDDEIIRCKDCIYLGERNNKKCCTRLEIAFPIMEDEDFCSRGKRRDTE